VRALLGNDFSRALPGLDEIAQRLHMTPATLHRRLGAEGTTFQRLKDECRRDVALALLRQQDLSGARIAERLGFSDASAFLRAFRKWTGLTPGEYRQRELRED
jgi:AraC-like DNA-binding protein